MSQVPCPRFHVPGSMSQGQFRGTDSPGSISRNQFPDSIVRKISDDLALSYSRRVDFLPPRKPLALATLLCGTCGKAQGPKNYHSPSHAWGQPDPASLLALWSPSATRPPESNSDEPARRLGTFAGASHRGVFLPAGLRQADNYGVNRGRLNNSGGSTAGEQR